MHIPDNYLSPSTCAVMAVAMVPVWTAAVKHVKKELPKEKLPQLGVFAALSFLLMMLNLPLPGGTTGHAVGGTLAAIILGPWASCLCISATLILQALLFGDGGVLAIGANCFNMAFILPFVGYSVYKLIRDHTSSEAGEYVGAAVGSYVGLNVAALFTAVEFGIQPYLFTDASGQALYCPYPLSVSIPAMLIPHLLVAGVAEALFTVLIYAFIRKTSPDLISDHSGKKTHAIWGLVLALIALTPLGLLATGTAWGEWGTEEVAELVDYTPSGMLSGFSFETLIPDYSLSGVPEVAGYLISAVLGVAILVILFKVIGSLLPEQKTTQQKFS